MARVRMVTRTITETKVEVMVCNIETATVETEVYTLCGDFTDDKDIIKYLEKHYQRDNAKFGAVNSKFTIEQLYGIEETEFIKLARVLPPRTTEA